MPPSPATGRPLSEQHIYLPYYDGETMHKVHSVQEESAVQYSGTTMRRDESQTILRTYKQTKGPADGRPAWCFVQYEMRCAGFEPYFD